MVEVMTDVSVSALMFPDSVAGDTSQQVQIKSEAGNLLLLLPPEGETGLTNPAIAFNWLEVWQQLKQRLTAGERFWQPGTAVHLIARDRLLDGRQLQTIADSLTEFQLQLKRVFTSRRQTAVAAATAGYSVDQDPTIAHLNQTDGESTAALEAPLYLEATLRSGCDIQHKGSVVILGDVNPGSSVIAEGDIIVWGRLRGMAHAGARGNARCLIMALQMEPTQLRIADAVARPPETPPVNYVPEVAYVAVDNGIRITRAIDFSRLPPLKK